MSQNDRDGKDKSTGAGAEDTAYMIVRGKPKEKPTTIVIPPSASTKPVPEQEPAKVASRPASLPGDTGGAGTEVTAYLGSPARAKAESAPPPVKGFSEAERERMQSRPEILPGDTGGAGTEATAYLGGGASSSSSSSNATAYLSGGSSSPNLDGVETTQRDTVRDDDISTIPFAKKGEENWDEFVGRELAGYKIKRKLAEGGMGVVYLGEHAKIGRKSAIKVLKLEFCSNAEVVERFHQEARAVNAIKHDNIVDIYDFGTDPEGRAFFVMELLQGESLADRLARGVLDYEESLPILQQSLRALSAAHQKGFTHRDLKPDNIWLRTKSDGTIQVKLLDFGIAKLLGNDSMQAKMTKTGVMMGTPDYMSPEQINGDTSIGPRADLYSFGCIIFEMFTRTTPFAAESMAGVMSGHLFRDPPKIAEVAGEDSKAPEGLDAVIERCLAKEADNRYPTALDLLEDLKALAANEKPTIAQELKKRATVVEGKSKTNVAPVSTAKTQISEPQVAKKKTGIIVAGVAAVAVAAGGVGLYLTKKKPSEEQKPVIAQPQPKPPQEPVNPPVAKKQLDPLTLRKESLAVVRNGLSAAEPNARAVAAQAAGEAVDGESSTTLVKLATSDADSLVRGWSATAIAQLGHKEAKEPLATAETSAPTALKVWYASALAKLGDADASKRLAKYASDDDVAVALKAALSLAETSAPGSKPATEALQSLAKKEAELNKVAPYAGTLILSKLAYLRFAKARSILYSLLGEAEEGTRLAAAVGLARISDDGGKQVLADVLANPSSANRLVAATALVELGDYTGYDHIKERLADKDAGIRREAALALGKIGEKESLTQLEPMLADSDRIISISAASAMLTIVAAEPLVLAQASVDWTKSALTSVDWNIRASGATVLGDLAPSSAVPLLAQAIADKEVGVRRAAAKSAGKIKSTDAAKTVISVVKVERDAIAKEEMVKSLGRIGDAVARETLTELAEDPGRIGMLASGSLIAVGDTAAVAKLQTGIESSATTVQLAVVQASLVANNVVVIPVLEKGMAAKNFEVSFSSAEALSIYNQKTDQVVEKLQQGLTKSQLDVKARSVVALQRLSVDVTNAKGVDPAELLDSPVAETRVIAVGMLKTKPWQAARGLVIRASADPVIDVRKAAADVLPTWADTNRADVVKVLKLMIRDGDGSVRSVAQSNLAKIGPSAFQVAAVQPVAPVVAPDAAPAPDDTAVLEEASKAVGEQLAFAKAAAETTAETQAKIKAIIDKPQNDDEDAKQVAALVKALESDLARQASTVGEIDRQITAVKTAAGATASDAAKAKLAEFAKQKAAAAEIAAKSKQDYTSYKPQIEEFAKAEAQDPEMLLAAANSALATGRLADAKRDLDRAAAEFKRTKTSNPSINWSYAQLWDKQSIKESDPAKRKALLTRAKAAYESFATSGGGKRAAQAKARAAEIAEELSGDGQ